VARKLQEYEDWGRRLLDEYAPLPRRLGPGYLLTESSLREQSVSALANATLGWAYAHTGDPDFLERSPTEVALYLLASRSALATAIRLGREAPPHLDYTPPYEDSYTEEELLVELLVGFTPLLGDVADLGSFLSGYSVTGHRLSEPERAVCFLAVVLPFSNSKLLREGGEETVERLALLSGRSVEEVHVLARVASHLAPEEVREIERILQVAAQGRELSQQELAFLNRMAQGLEKPLREAVDLLRGGQKLPLLGVRTLPDGTRLVAGTPVHKAQCWVDYQFRHPGKYRRFSYAMDPEWERLYRSILENKGAGNAFEDAILQAKGYEKNTAMMMPPPGSQAKGFIADAVPGNPTPGELVWGKPYRFVEVKARKSLAFTGNLKAMLEYVGDYGGHVELWLRSSKHPAGATRLTRPLQKRLSDLKDRGLVSINYFP
jgi:hypothetical protein